MSGLKHRPWSMILLLVFLWFATPYLMGSLAGQSVRSSVFKSGTVNFNGRELPFSLSGGTDHSLAWSLSGASSMLLEIGYEDGAGNFFWISPAEVGGGVANPIVAGAADAISIFIPVAKKARLTVTGAVTGTIVFSDS